MNPALEPATCTLTRAEYQALRAVRIRGITWTDPLVELARTRAINPQSWAYEHARRRAMKPVNLRLCDFRAVESSCRVLRQWFQLERAA